MTATRDAFVSTLRAQASARAAHVVPPPLTTTNADALAACDEFDDAKLLLDWVKADATRSLALNGSGNLSLIVSAAEEDSVAITTGQLAPLSSTQRATLRGEL